MKKRVLYLATYNPTLPGTGAGTRGIGFINFFAKKYDMRLFFMEGFGHSPEKTKIKTSPKIPKELCSITKIKYSDLGYFFFSMKLYRAVQRLMEKIKFDFIFADFEKAGIYAYLLSRKYKVPFIYNSHNVEYIRYIDFARNDPRRYFFVPYLYFIERLSCTKASLVAAITEEDAKVFRKWIDEEKLIVIPGGFDEKIFHPYYNEPKPDPPIILFVGNFNILGNREAVYLVRDRIVDKVVSKYPNVVFQFIGANPPRDVPHPNFKFTGFVEDLLPYLRRANLVIVPVIKGGGIRIKTIEALACGKYIVSTPKGVEGIHQKLSSLVICEIDQFAQVICEVLSKKKFIFREDYQMIKNEYSANSILEKLDCKIRKVFGY